MELNFTLSDPIPVRSPFARLHLRQVLLRVAAQVAQFVQIFVDARGDYPAIAQRERRLWNQRAVDLLPQIAEFVDRDMQHAQRVADSGRGRDSAT